MITGQPWLTTEVSSLAYEGAGPGEYSERMNSSSLLEDAEELVLAVDNIAWIEGSLSLTF